MRHWAQQGHWRTERKRETSDLKTLKGFPGQHSSLIFSSAADEKTTSICSSCRRRSRRSSRRHTQC